MNERKAVPSAMAAELKRQKRAQLRLLFFWCFVAFLVLGVGGTAAYLLQQEAGNYSHVNIETQISPANESLLAAVPVTSTLSAVVLQETATPLPTRTPLPRVIDYTVQDGESMASIATKFGSDLYSLTALNPTITPEFLKAGDEIAVWVLGGDPATPTPALSGEYTFVDYQVLPGDTLAGIAIAFGTTVDAIVIANNLASADQISDGQALRVPVLVATATPGQVEPGLELTPTVSATPAP